MKNQNLEIEAHFLDVDPQQLHSSLIKQGADDRGEDFLKETIFYDKELTWKEITKFVRMRTTKKGTLLTLKHFQYPSGKRDEFSKPVVQEIEIKVDNAEKAQQFLEQAGLVAYRVQEKKRHTYILDGVTVDVDTWPSVPSYAEIEGDSEQEIKKVAEKLGFDWSKAVFRGAGYIIEQYLHVTVRNLRYLTFAKIE